MNKQEFNYKIIITLEYGIQQVITTTYDEMYDLIVNIKDNKEITFRHIRFHSNRIVSLQLFKKTKQHNVFEDYTFTDFQKQKEKEDIN